MIIKNACFILGICFLVIGAITLFIPTASLTGFAVYEGVNYKQCGFAGAVLVLLGMVFFGFGSKKIDGVRYDDHALDRLVKREIMPSAVKNALKHGKCYKLKKQTEGGTHAYITYNSVNKKGKNFNLLVIAKGKRVKTTYVRRDSEIRAFLRTYT